MLLLLLEEGAVAAASAAPGSARSWRGWTRRSTALGRERLEPTAASAAVVGRAEGAGADIWAGEIDCGRRSGVNLCSARARETEGVGECAAEAESRGGSHEHLDVHRSRRWGKTRRSLPNNSTPAQLRDSGQPLQPLDQPVLAAIRKLRSCRPAEREAKSTATATHADGVTRPDWLEESRPESRAC